MGEEGEGAMSAQSLSMYTLYAKNSGLHALKKISNWAAMENTCMSLKLIRNKDFLKLIYW